MVTLDTSVLALSLLVKVERKIDKLQLRDMLSYLPLQ